MPLLPPWDDTPVLSWNDRGSRMPTLYQLHQRSTRTKDYIYTTEKFLNEALLDIQTLNERPVTLD